ncbi:hypothetical protein FHX37_0856 [Haloactinospora alba]|uniref:Integral membrane protein n=1 Tax=Haloactinospora alba TaxID=405555 RepID=A0A543NGI5_9ACTN|nr:hypothetical protein [Haloactinospora alba]TQN30967.1 hypothetical protein FHX37_0856 [Haloactinospora alba]
MSYFRTTETGSPDPAAPGPRHRWDVVTAVAGALFVLTVAAIGWVLEYEDGEMSGDLHVDFPPLHADWLPHVGPGSPAACTVAVLTVVYGPRVADRTPWRGLLPLTWLAAMAWTWSLALVDGWRRGVAEQLTNKYEYLHEMDRFADVGTALRGFTQHILKAAPDNWAVHVAGHPPGAVLTFVALDRVGLGGGTWAAVWCITAGSSAAVAVLLAVRALSGESVARRAAPFVALAPAAVWVGVSADGYFAAVAAWGVTLLALAATRTVRYPTAAALASGLLLGLVVYLSYGLTLMAIPAVAVLLITRAWRPLPPVLVGALTVAAVFTLAGFYWWEAYVLLVERYYEGVGGVRPFSYWVWGNLANVVISGGLAALAGTRRAAVGTVAAGRRWWSRENPAASASGSTDGLVLLVLAVVLAIAVADLSGMSKAETARIWLPFTVWLLPAAALLPAVAHRYWLSGQAALALAINHLLLTSW